MSGAAPKPIRPLDPTELARLHTMSVRARVIVEGAYAGLHHNPSLGTAIEFSEHKEYAPGDDIRRIDWKAVGRHDRYYIKRFEDESEMRTFLVLDTSASMGYHGAERVSKLTYATYLAAALVYLLGKQRDPAGLCVFDSALRHYLPPATSPGHVRDALHLLDTLMPEGGTDLGRALERVGNLAERRSLILVFSDLLDAETRAPARRDGATAERTDVARGPVADHLAQLRQRGHDLALFHILDADELELPGGDLTQYIAIEPGDTRALVCDPDDLRISFHEASLAFRERWRRAASQARIEYRLCPSHVPPADVLRSFIGERQRRYA